jgi:inosose dehydratase
MDGERRSIGSGANRPGSTETVDSPLTSSPVGTVPILWNNVDVPDLAPRVAAETVLDEIARLGFDGTQTGAGFPEGPQLATALERRGLRLAEVYAALPCSIDGPLPEAVAIGRERLATLDQAGGEVLVVALELSPEREAVAGRGPGRAEVRLTTAGWTRLFRVLEAMGRDAGRLGHIVAFHPHAGTFVETPDEVERLLTGIAGLPVGICLDVGHYTLGGGDPVAAIGRMGSRVLHVHLKDVAREPLERLRAGELGGFRDALRARIFTELGAGVVDIAGVLAALTLQRYAGWLMLEQDTTWRPPSESAAINRGVLDYAVRHVGTVVA